MQAALAARRRATKARTHGAASFPSRQECGSQEDFHSRTNWVPSTGIRKAELGRQIPRAEHRLCRLCRSASQTPHPVLVLCTGETLSAVKTAYWLKLAQNREDLPAEIAVAEQVNLLQRVLCYKSTIDCTTAYVHNTIRTLKRTPMYICRDEWNLISASNEV